MRWCPQHQEEDQRQEETNGANLDDEQVVSRQEGKLPKNGWCCGRILLQKPAFQTKKKQHLIIIFGWVPVHC